MIGVNQIGEIGLGEFVMCNYSKLADILLELHVDTREKKNNKTYSSVINSYSFPLEQSPHCDWDTDKR